MGKYGGFAKQHLPTESPGIPCDSCGMEVASTNSRVVSGATCVWCSSIGPVRGRKAERLARRKGGRVRR